MKERYSHELKRWQKWLGIWRINKDSVDTKWGYFAPRWTFELRFNKGGYFSNQCSLDFGFIWGMFHVKLPIFLKDYEADCEWDDYGFYWFENTFVLKWGKKSKHIDLPFVSWEFDHHVVEGRGGNVWIDGASYWDKMDAIQTYELDYTYTLESGEVQNRIATCFRERRQWHRKWLPFLKKVNVAINIDFNDEVGERSGTWKGGTMGCGYDMLPGETVEQCLRRMEKERKFT
ncbi:hypothetical protein [Vibrio phage R01]|nr:hypothetical protein [Vibrio phage R01]